MAIEASPDFISLIEVQAGVPFRLPPLMKARPFVENVGDVDILEEYPLKINGIPDISKGAIRITRDLNFLDGDVELRWDIDPEEGRAFRTLGEEEFKEKNPILPGYKMGDGTIEIDPDTFPREAEVAVSLSVNYQGRNISCMMLYGENLQSFDGEDDGSCGIENGQTELRFNKWKGDDALFPIPTFFGPPKVVGSHIQDPLRTPHGEAWWVIYEDRKLDLNSVRSHITTEWAS